MSFDKRWVVVSGASSGIGRAVSIELSAQGASVVLLGRDQGRLQETAGALVGPAHRVLALDLERHADILPAIQGLRSDVGPLYGLCHAAGVVQTRPLASTGVGVLQAQLNVNLLAGLELARSICRRDVLTEEGGSLLFISSVYGRAGMAGQIGYSATKGAVAAAVRGLAVELARRQVRANCISPGLVFTDMTRKSLAQLSGDQVERLKAAHPLGPGQPEDVAHASAFLLSPESRWITVDGGYTAQ
jgi:NAD(P)-dependent dehydrogenase (short-subunit alcohol dehydrogenase family)